MDFLTAQIYGDNSVETYSNGFMKKPIECSQ